MEHGTGVKLNSPDSSLLKVKTDDHVSYRISTNCVCEKEHHSICSRFTRRLKLQELHLEAQENCEPSPS